MSTEYSINLDPNDLAVLRSTGNTMDDDRHQIKVGPMLVSTVYIYLSPEQATAIAEAFTNLATHLNQQGATT